MAFWASLKSVGSQIAEKLRHPNRTPRKLVNFGLYLLEQKLLQHGRAWNMPTEAFVDVCSICNLRCPLCPTGLRLESNKKGRIGLDDFRRIVDQLAPWVFDLHLYNWGEPFLNRDILDMVRYARSRNVRTLVSSNLNTMPPEGETGIVESGLDVLMVSLDGASQESYGRYRVGGAFDRVVDHMRRIVREKRRRGASRPVVEWRFLVMRHNEHEQEEAARLAKEIGVDRIVFEPMRVNMYLDVFTPVSELIESDRGWLPVLDRRYDHDRRRAKAPLGRCPQPWRWISIDWDGDAFPCCSIYDDQFAFGNAFREGVARIWNGPAFRAARRIVSRKGMAEPSDVVCAYCHRYRIAHRREFPRKGELLQAVRERMKKAQQIQVGVT